jgi:hypothetical protein
VADNPLLVRNAVERAANKDRPGEVKHVGNVRFLRGHGCASGEAASANVRYTTKDPSKIALWFACLKGNHWVVSQGPLYGE